jgi:hypothetical protein
LANSPVDLPWVVSNPLKWLVVICGMLQQEKTLQQEKPLRRGVFL